MTTDETTIEEANRDFIRDIVRADLDAAYALARGRLDADDPQLAGLETSLGNLARLDERFDDALAHHERALALDRRLGEAHPRVGRDHHNIGGILRRLDRRAEALTHYERALEIKQSALGSHPEVALTLNSMGLLAFEAGDLARARTLYERAHAMFVEHDHGQSAMVAHNLALLDLAEAAGLDPAFSCRSGICGTCATRLKSGAVDYIEEPSAPHGDDEVLICCSTPRSTAGDATCGEDCGVILDL